MWLGSSNLESPLWSWTSEGWSTGCLAGPLFIKALETIWSLHGLLGTSSQHGSLRAVTVFTQLKASRVGIPEPKAELHCV